MSPLHHSAPSKSLVTGEPGHITLADVWNEIECWLKDEPQLGSTELLLKFEDAHPEKFTEGHRRILQRRLQEWRVNVIRELVCGTRAESNISVEAIKQH
ncbi:hypothetical protein RBC57_003730 [Salmonella enterica]|uniref:Uncharacterized protein n=1 Tax=Salmonella enterica TaxID=28901 RepID=A0A628V6J6_SALER|nr:hypothetical protein [Salmonella enterica]EDF5515181.1 hypothetical protein [Salmonella enterica]EEC6701465.1 hypothetical protein [Salmonella enterica]ELF5201524.1 hypothetical protein [Salmonella enterica]